MGELLAKIGKIRLGAAEFSIELNSPTHEGAEEQIHIQSETMRLELDKNEFLRLAAGVMVAEENLKRLKKLK